MLHLSSPSLVGTVKPEPAPNRPLRLAMTQTGLPTRNLPTTHRVPRVPEDAGVHPGPCRV